MSGHNLIEQLEALANLLRSEQRLMASEQHLQLVHLQILHYLNRCNRYSDSLLTLCEYLGQTRGTVSQSVTLLENKGYLRKVPDPQDRRKTHLHLTPDGISVADQLPTSWQKGLDLLSAEENDQIGTALKLLLTRVQQANQFKAFGQCQYCKHLKQRDNQHYCGLTGEDLNTDELKLICVFYE